MTPPALSLTDFTNLVEHYSREFAQRSLENAVTIATMSSTVRGMLAHVLQTYNPINDYGKVMSVCHHVDALPAFQALNPQLQREQIRVRSEITAILLRKLHALKVQDAQSRGEDLKRVSAEWLMAMRTSAWLAENAEGLPVSFGPEWMEQHADEEFTAEVKAYVYNLKNNAYEWERFATLLPQHVRERFDPTKVGLTVPSGFANHAEASAFLQAFMAHHSLQPQDWADNFQREQVILKLPGGALLVSYFADLEEGNQPAHGADTDDVPDADD